MVRINVRMIDASQRQRVSGTVAAPGQDNGRSEMDEALAHGATSVWNKRGLICSGNRSFDAISHARRLVGTLRHISAASQFPASVCRTSVGRVSDLRAQEVRRSFRKRSLVSAPKKRLRIRDQCGARLQFLRPIHLVFRVLRIRFGCTGAITSRRRTI